MACMDNLLEVRQCVSRRFEGGEGYKEKPCGSYSHWIRLMRRAQDEPKEMDFFNELYYSLLRVRNFKNYAYAFIKAIYKELLPLHLNLA